MSVREKSLQLHEKSALLQAGMNIAFQDILEEVSKASVVIEDMLTLARADFESQEKTLEAIDFGTIVRDACEMASPHAQDRSFNISVHAEQPITVLGDFLGLRRLVWILIDNAFKYTDRAGVVEVCVVQQAGYAKLTVSDTGIGISEKDLPHIFDRFFRADPSRSEIEGTGLGLAIAKWISDVHHGTLHVESQQGTGTIFTFTLPTVVRSGVTAAI